MLIDAQREADIPTDGYDLCIIGAGAAGIACALEFQNTDIKVCLLEAGGLEYSAESQAVYKGEVIGIQYEPLDICRLRFLGGTTNHWSGYCHHLPRSAFKRKDWVPYSGWPIELDDVVEYYDRAAKFLNLPRASWHEESGWSLDDVQPLLREPRIHLDEHGFKKRAVIIYPARLGRGKYRDALRDSENIHVHYNANVVEVAAHEQGASIDHVRVKTFSGRELTYKAGSYVLAASGLENARLMLASTAVQENGIGNQNDLVGRFFSDHAMVYAGRIATANPGVDIDFYDRRSMDHGDVIVWHEMTYELQQELKLMPVAFRMSKLPHDIVSSAGVSAAKYLATLASQGRMPDDLGAKLSDVLCDFDTLAGYGASWLWHGTSPANHINVVFHLAPAPNPDSRVTLGTETDELGLPRVRLDWRLTELDYRTIRWITQRCVQTVAASGLGRMQVEYDVDDIDSAIVMDKHHIGTTRMSHSDVDGVVDSNCKVFGIDNLYVAGSSVFTTCGWGSPTFLIVALAQRLADHLKNRVN
jgi:choline dehydrogenase-like flavoprotein